MRSASTSKTIRQTRIKIACVLCALALVLGSLCGCSSGISENEFVLRQNDTIENLTQLAKNTEEVYTLYLTTAMEESEFLAELDLLYAQYQVCAKVYSQNKVENRIAPGQSSWASSKAVESLEAVFRTFELLYVESVASDGQPLDRKQMSYLYLARKDEIESYVMDFTIAKSYILEAEEGADITESEEDAT